jgi:putative Mg2+ transporter-C (MgtC) family protein
VTEWLGGAALAQVSILGDVAIAMGLGAVLGWERERLGKPAGLRTLMLVAAASTLFVSMGDVVVEGVDAEVAGAVLRTDPLRLLEAVVAGVSFLGAGTIIRRRHGDEVEGLTTAATMLVTAGIGACVALDQLYLAIGVTLLVLVTLTLVRWLETRVDLDDSANGDDAQPTG